MKLLVRVILLSIRKDYIINLAYYLYFAVKYYGLTENPGRKAGSMGKLKAESFNYWTHKEFKQFIKNISWPDIYAAINILYWTGIRAGELLALMAADINMEGKALPINKSLQRIDKKDIITAPTYTPVNTVRLQRN